MRRIVLTKTAKLSRSQAKRPLEFFWFDFHAECKHFQFDRLEKLFDMTQECIRNGG